MRATITLAALFVCLQLALLTTEASFFSTISRPFRNVYEKAVNLKDRRGVRRGGTSSNHNARRIEARSVGLGPAAMGAGEKRVSTSRSNASSSQDEGSSEFAAKCFVERGPSFKKPPTLYFYSSRTHNNQTLGCAVTEQIDLEPINGELSEEPKLDDQAIKRQLIDTSLFDPQVPTYFTVHGFLSSWNGENWMCTIKDMVLNGSAANVFIVDWSGGSKPMLPIDYSASVSNTQYVGALLGEFINTLNRLTGQLDARNYHMIGHSLGAHICGFAGYYVNALGRITGLDPAGPCFGTDSDTTQEVASNTGELEHGKRRLSPQSAELVIALHTDTALFGLNENCAHYDVYVNGGFKQPECGSISPVARFQDLIRLNVKETFNVNIACAHSYSHKLLNKFVGFVKDGLRLGGRLAGILPPGKADIRSLVVADGSGESGARSDDGDDMTAHCFSMAYQCADWESFKAGECGFCRDNDIRCVYTGLSSVDFQPSKTNDDDKKYDSANAIAMNSKNKGSDDYEFNDEDEELGSGDENDAQSKEGKLDLKPSDKYSRGQHYLRSGSSGATCLFHYQIIIATKRSSNDEAQNDAQGDESTTRKHFYYLHVPLERSGRLTDGQGHRRHDRLVQVSHKLERESAAYATIRMDYLKTVGDQVDSNADLDFYTALITFKQPTTLDQCRQDETNGAGRKDVWHICKPLDNLQEARLWSSSSTKLDRVAFVALNYMSGLSHAQRMRESYVLKRDSASVNNRDEIENEARAELSELEPEKSGSFSNKVEKVTSTASCLLSVFDTSNTGHAKHNFKCERSSKELRFAIHLSPMKLDAI